MSRKLKNIIMIIIVFLLLIGIGFTGYFAKKDLSSSLVNNYLENDNRPSEFGPKRNDNDSSTEKYGDSNKMAPPEKPSGENEKNGITPPEMPNSENENSNNEQMTPPEMPGEEGNTDGTDRMTPPDMRNVQLEATTSDAKINTIYYVALGIESILVSLIIVYIIMSKFNKKSFKGTFNIKEDKIIFVLSVVILAGVLTFAEIYTVNNYIDNNIVSSNNGKQFQNERNNNTSGKTTYSSTNEITEDKTISGISYESSKSDENAVLVNGDVKVSLENITVNKTGDSDGGDSTSFYGTNSAILAINGANLNINNATITTDAKGANGVFSYGGTATTNNSSGDGTTITISNSKIVTSGNNAGGIMTTGGGTTIANNLDITTNGISSAAIRSDRGGGVVAVTGGTYKTTNQGSPAIYSTAEITVTDARLVSTASEGVVIEGKNSVTLNNCELVDTNNKLNGNSTTYKNVFLYQSMSGDASTGTSVFSATSGSITTNKGDTFYVTNTDAVINIKNVTITNNDSTGNFLRIQKDSWGKSGNNGGNVTLNTELQSIEGNIVVDEISTLNINMITSTFKGIINGDNTAKSISVRLDKDSKIVLTGDSYVTSFDNEDSSNSNIDFNGYKLYVNGKAI